MVDLKKPDEIVEKMRILIDDVRMRKEMGKRGYERARQKYRWEIMKKRMIRAYETLS